jgi:hypothetical protein
MSFLNKFKGLGRKDSANDIDTLEQDRYDDAPGRHDANDMALPGSGGTVALDVGAMQQTAQMDSSIITEAAPSEMAEFTEVRRAGDADASAAGSGLPVIGDRPLGEQQRILGGRCCWASSAWWRYILAERREPGLGPGGCHRSGADAVAAAGQVGVAGPDRQPGGLPGGA